MAERGSEGGSVFMLTVQAFLVFVVLDVGFRLFGFARVYRLVERWGRSTAAPAGPPDPARVVDRTRRALRTATRYYWRRGLDCLPRSLTLYLLLRRRGVPAALRIGVKRYPFGAHAWVECRGEVLDDTPTSRRQEPYVPILSS